VAGGRSTAEDFRLARLARTRYRLADLTLAADLATARTIAARVNAGRTASAGTVDPVTDEGAVAAEGAVAVEPLTPGQLHAAGLLVTILGRLVDRYRVEADPTALVAADAWLRDRLGNASLATAISAFSTEFPARLTVPETPDPPTAVAQLLLLASLDENAAVDPFRELVDLRAVRDGKALGAVADALEGFFGERPGFGPEGRSLVELLRQPAAAAPGSLADQLRWIRTNWAGLFDGAIDDLLDKLLVALDVLAEERQAADRAWFATHDPGAGGPTEVYQYELGEEERFSQDRDWMPRLVLIAKSTYVWLDQLSRRYSRDIRRLDAVPDEELDTLAIRGITGLWLIGLWERSSASERIKRLRGDPEAVASAYSLDDYRIAADLGGLAALADLRTRAGARGIRLASDMVPNHMGIDSSWVVQHPDRFLSLPYSPFPAYRFDGPDLSSDERVGIVLEDHYYDSTDAAVVFKRFDRQTGDERYVYHGNDGTSFPWNDTAQLDYSKAAVREAVIQTILEVARQFPVIRFDAAMVLARKHVQRLWFPEPGHGGAIPSRAGHGMTRAEFDRAMPREFWREVVDRVADEVPGTLLLAEAFWMLEGYFVRTLGMHRVYNSAFMNMLRDELNAEYRMVIKNTLEFDPAILGRFVNFMSNPDERTAVDQFGSGDKYFGVAALMATLPGLPMFGHGQVEGFTEKYGMEYRRAKRDEPVDEGLLAHHGRTIFPLLHRRADFAGSDGFRLYDLVADDGSVNENVYAYSNVGPGGSRSLVIYHNAYAEAHGWIRESTAFNAREADGERRLRRESLASGLGLSGADDRFVLLRDAMSGREGLRSSAQIVRDGFRVELAAYECRVYLDLGELPDGARPVRRLAERLGHGTVTSVDEALLLLELEPEHAAIRDRLTTALAGTDGGDALAAAVRVLEGLPFDEQRLWPIVRDSLAAAGFPAEAADRATDVVRGLVLAERRVRRLDRGSVADWFVLPSLRDALAVHEADGISWFDRNRFELLVETVAALAATGTSDIGTPSEGSSGIAAVPPGSVRSAVAIGRLLDLAKRAEYRVEALLAALDDGPGSMTRA
jgi:glycosidase